MTPAQERIDTRPPGIALIASSIVAVVAMGHHPVPGGADFTAWARSVERIGALNEAVHGTMIFLVGVLTWALSAFAIRRGVHRSLVTLGLVAWAMGALSMIIAPVLNGFVVTDIARRALASPESADMLRIALQAMWAGDRVIVLIGVMAMSAAILFWSADLTTGVGVVRWAGLFGVAAGLAPLVSALSRGLVGLNTGGMMLAFGVWAVWFVGIGALMIQRKV
jgi:hypothetical protein